MGVNNRGISIIIALYALFITAGANRINNERVNPSDVKYVHLGKRIKPDNIINQY